MNATLANVSLRSPETVRTTELRSAADLERIESAWFELWRISGSSVFQSPMWLIPWVKNFTADNLRARAFFQGDCLLAVALFYTWHDAETRKLFLAGNGISDHLDICVKPEAAGRIAPLIEQWICSGAEWDAVEVNQLPPDSILATSGENGEPVAVIDLDGSNNYAPARQLEKLRYYRRRLAKKYLFEIVRADANSVEPFMNALIELHGARWRERGESGVLSSADVRSFHLEAARRLFARGALRLYALKARTAEASATAGVLYAFTNSRETFFYLSGFDPSFARFSPGTILIGHAIEQAVAERHIRFDFLRGREPYKYSWGASDRATVRRAFSLTR